MRYSDLDPATQLIKTFEGCELKAYLCPGGQPTVGYGHTGPDVELGMTITQEQADLLLQQDVQKHSQQLDRVLRENDVNVNTNQYCALLSFVFNLGIGNFKNSTMLKYLKEGDYKKAAAEFPKWNKAGGKVSPGLVRRRAAEQRLFETK